MTSIIIKNKCFFITIIIVFYSNSSLFAIQKTINLLGDETVISITQSEEYINVISSNPNSKYKLEVYNQEGKSIFKTDYIENGIKLAQTLNGPHSLIYILQGGSKNRIKAESLDKIISIDLKTGTENWSIDSYSDNYEISPDQKYLITNVQPIVSNVNAPFEIINLSNGNKTLQKNFNYVYHAIWYDVDKILFAFQEFNKEKNPKYNEMLVAEKNMEGIIHKRSLIRYKYKNGEISEKEYFAQKTILDQKIENFSKKKKQFSYRRNSIQKNKYELLPAKLGIFNIKTNMFEIEKSIFSEDGEPVFLQNLHIAGLLSVDKDKNVFFRGKKNKSSEKFKDRIIKLDNKLDNVWEYHINHPYGFAKIIKNNEVYFGIKNKSDYYLLSTEKKQIKSQIDILNIIPKNISEEKMFMQQLVNIHENISVKKDGRTINISNEKGEY
jgi:hypothetical protein